MNYICPPRGNEAFHFTIGISRSRTGSSLSLRKMPLRETGARAFTQQQGGGCLPLRGQLGEGVPLTPPPPVAASERRAPTEIPLEGYPHFSVRGGWVPPPLRPMGVGGGPHPPPALRDRPAPYDPGTRPIRQPSGACYLRERPVSVPSPRVLLPPVCVRRYREPLPPQPPFSQGRYAGA